MVGAGDLAKILYWSCVLWPITGAIGIYACHHLRARMQCHLAVTLILFCLTIASAFIQDDFYLSMIWNHDGLTCFLRVMIAAGVLLASLLMKFWIFNPSGFSGNEKIILSNLVLFHVLVCVSMMAVAINNIFIALIFLYSLGFLLLLACFLNGGSEQVRVGWNYFRHLLFFMIITLMGVFILGISTVQPYPLLPRFGSFILAFGAIQMAGLFPVSIVFLRLIRTLPIVLGSIAIFIIPIAFLSLFVRLAQIPAYQPPVFFLVVMGGLSVVVILLKEQDNPFLISPFLLVVLAALAGIFSNSFGGIYSFCLLIAVLVLYAPLGCILDKNLCHPVFKGWFMVALSAFPPFGIFFACSVLIADFMTQIPWLGYGLFILFSLRGYSFFKGHKMQLFSQEILTREGYFLMGLILLPSIMFPVLAKYWVFQIAEQFIQK